MDGVDFTVVVEVILFAFDMHDIDGRQAGFVFFQAGTNRPLHISESGRVGPSNLGRFGDPVIHLRRCMTDSRIEQVLQGMHDRFGDRRVVFRNCPEPLGAGFAEPFK